jgi:cold shock CspA family protein
LSLMGAALIEPHDPSIGTLALAQTVAITHSGLAHLEMALFNLTFFEQMALTSLIANPEVARQIRSQYSSGDALKFRLRKVREIFATFLIEEDERFGRVPESAQYNVQKAVSADIRKFCGGTSEAELSRRDAVAAAAEPGLVTSGANGVVDWFDQAKGYGFVTLEHLGESAFLHISVLEKSGIDEIHDGDAVIVDVARSHKGIAVSAVKKTGGNKSNGPKVLDVVVAKVFADRGYGFVYVPALRQDAFFHLSILPQAERGSVDVGMTLRGEINADPKGRGLQVRRIAQE